ncbi:MAG: PIN domain-containing protein [Hyphomicrobiales bacterium]|nr:MAG: PIN domain-containing protein [Hyphomicrobiales bacterium]
MIGVDTNILVRLFVRDHAEQTEAAATFLSARSESDPAFVSAVVLAELAWVLDKSYGYSTASIHGALEWLFDSENVAVERSDLMEDAIASAQETGADISDSIIAAIANDAGAAKTVTFDKRAAKRIPGMELLA